MSLDLCLLVIFVYVFYPMGFVSIKRKNHVVEYLFGFFLSKHESTGKSKVKIFLIKGGITIPQRV